MDYSWQQKDEKGLAPFWPAGLPPVRPLQHMPLYQTKVRNRFQPFAENDDEVLVEEGEQQPAADVAQQAEQQPCWNDDVATIEFEDDDNEPEELKRQKSCEAPTHRQRQ